MPTEQSFGKGAIHDIPDPRDYKWKDIAVAKSLPPFNWASGYDIEQVLGKEANSPNFALTVNNQGQTGSCGGQAWSKYGEVLSLIYDGVLSPKSAKFIYAQTFQKGGGSNGKDNSNIVINQGWGNEVDTPSYIGGVIGVPYSGSAPTEDFMERPQDITPQARQNASKDEALSYANTAVDIDDIAQAISNNYGVIIEVAGQDNGTWLTVNPTPPSSSNANPLWYHWVYCGKARLNNGVKQIGILNSWGKEIGENGWQWLDEAYFTSSILNGWTLVYNSNQAINKNTTSWLQNLINRFHALFS